MVSRVSAGSLFFLIPLAAGSRFWEIPLVPAGSQVLTVSQIPAMPQVPAFFAGVFALPAPPAQSRLLSSFQPHYPLSDQRCMCPNSTNCRFATVPFLSIAQNDHLPEQFCSCQDLILKLFRTQLCSAYAERPACFFRAKIFLFHNHTGYILHHLPPDDKI